MIKGLNPRKRANEQKNQANLVLKFFNAYALDRRKTRFSIRRKERQNVL